MALIDRIYQPNGKSMKIYWVTAARYGLGSERSWREI